MNTLATLMIAEGQPGAAKELSTQAVRTGRSLFGDRAPTTLSSILIVARLLDAQGGPGASDLFDKVLDGRRQVLGEDHSGTQKLEADLKVGSHNQFTMHSFG